MNAAVAAPYLPAIYSVDSTADSGAANRHSKLDAKRAQCGSSGLHRRSGDETAAAIGQSLIAYQTVGSS